ncbi:class I SAM-dependent methyltransferase [Burkholderia seminalis]|uniref:class I SAM-dependent methyltransferase n=1 Tax=Burkholderia seminalis TaxID=488731 RepID=UPI003C7E18AA
MQTRGACPSLRGLGKGFMRPHAGVRRSIPASVALACPATEQPDSTEWTTPVSQHEIEQARAGKVTIYLTDKPINATWLPPLKDLNVLCLASGGGQQGPILAAAGAKVTVLDNSPEQLEHDIKVAFQHRLQIRTQLGDMRDLSEFHDSAFDLVVHPVSNLLVPDIRPVWREVGRVIRSGGVLISGFKNPIYYLFGRHPQHSCDLRARYPIPYSDVTSITYEERIQLYGELAPLEFGHTLTDQIGGQLDAGFAITHFAEDSRDSEPISRYTCEYISTRAISTKGDI